MKKRPITFLERRWLLKELEAWRDQSLISPEQSNSILSTYQSTEESNASQRSWAVFALMSISALLVGLAVLLVLGYNWDAIPDTMKLGLMFCALFGLHATGFKLRFQGARRGSEIAFFLGCIVYGCGIFLIGQIFHVNAHYPDGVWWWALGIVPFALCVDTVLLHAMLVSILAIWCGMEIIGFSDLGAWFFGRWGFLANGAYTLPLMAIPGSIWAYRKNSAATVFLYVGLITWWVTLQPFAWKWDEQLFPAYIGSAGAILLLCAGMHGVGNRMAIPYRLAGIFLSAGLLTLASFHDFSEELGDHDPQTGLVCMAAIIGFGALAVAAYAFVTRRYGLMPSNATGQISYVVQKEWLPISLVGVFAAMAGASTFDHSGVVIAVIANLAMVGLAIWLMQVGLEEDRGVPFAAGVAYFLLWTMCRYFDLFGDFGGMLGAALLFALCGGVLFGVAWYWRQRKEVQHV